MSTCKPGGAKVFTSLLRCQLENCSYGEELSTLEPTIVTMEMTLASTLMKIFQCIIRINFSANIIVASV